jgi:hypothetical protein
MDATFIGAALRGTTFFAGGSPLTFVAVMLVVGAVSLSIWRLAYTTSVIERV